MGTTQQLNQQVCQKYGWSCQFAKDDDGRWYVDVVVSAGNSRRFTCPEKQEDDKKGKEVASELALEGLREFIRNEEAKEVKQLKDVFLQPISILDSYYASTWQKFWQNPPKIVGIDVEGNQKSPPVLVQVSTDDFVILEAPKQEISKNLHRVLQDDNIIKVFCDNFSHKDKISLGLSASDDFSQPPIIDIEVLCLDLFGPVKVPRGLSKLISMSMPELNVRIQKPKHNDGNMKGRYSNIGRYAMIEQGKAKPLRGVFDLNKEEQRYAALDAWCTLKAYHRLQEAKDKLLVV